MTKTRGSKPSATSEVIKKQKNYHANSDVVTSQPGKKKKRAPEFLKPRSDVKTDQKRQRPRPEGESHPPKPEVIHKQKNYQADPPNDLTSQPERRKKKEKKNSTPEFLKQTNMQGREKKKKKRMENMHFPVRGGWTRIGGREGVDGGGKGGKGSGASCPCLFPVPRLLCPAAQSALRTRAAPRGPQTGPRGTAGKFLRFRPNSNDARLTPNKIDKTAARGPSTSSAAGKRERQVLGGGGNEGTERPPRY